MSLDFLQLPSRIEGLYEELAGIARDPSASDFFGLAEASYKGGPGSAMRASGFGTFDQQGAGYYGERGLSLAVKTLCTLFPQNSQVFDLVDFRSIPYRALIEEVLVPETFVLLIGEDLTLEPDDAVETLHLSRRFGNIMYPDVEADESDDERVIFIKAEPVEAPVHSTTASKGKGRATEVIEISDDED
jgi:hypothetical protein